MRKNRFEIRISNKASKAIKKMPKGTYTRIKNAISLLAFNPYIGKKLDGDLAGRYTYRVWPYRIIYRILNKILVVEVLTIGHRKDIYKNN